MTDLAYCYNHMTDEILGSLDLLAEESDPGELSDQELEIPSHAVPPNPDDYDALPSEVHPSYPYGDPTSLNHPAALPHTGGDPTSRALCEDMIYLGTTTPMNAALRWKELALDHLLPINEEKAEAERAALARKIAAGNTPSHNLSGDGTGGADQGDQPETDEDNAEQEGEES